MFFETLPSFLEGANYFKIPSKRSAEKELKIVVYRPSTIYIALGKKNKFPGRNVGTSAVDKNDWTRLTENGIKTGSISLDTIFEKRIKEKGRSLISFNLLGSTKQAVIFIVGKVAINYYRNNNVDIHLHIYVSYSRISFQIEFTAIETVKDTLGDKPFLHKILFIIVFL